MAVSKYNEVKNMGGGRSTASAMYGIYRKKQISEGMIERTMKEYEVPIDVGYMKVKVVNEKQWAGIGGGPKYAAFVRGGTMFIRRKYFAGKQSTKTFIHEILHGEAGPKRYASIGVVLEEGTVEYIAEGTSRFGVRGRSASYAKGHHTYEKEVNIVSTLMQIVGRKKFIKYWKKGFAVGPGSDPYQAGHQKLARDLSDRGFNRTANIIRNEYYGTDYSRKEATDRLKQALVQDMQKKNITLYGIEPGETVRDHKSYRRYDDDFLDSEN